MFWQMDYLNFHAITPLTFSSVNLRLPSREADWLRVEWNETSFNNIIYFILPHIFDILLRNSILYKLLTIILCSWNMLSTWNQIFFYLLHSFRSSWQICLSNFIKISRLYETVFLNVHFYLIIWSGPTRLYAKSMLQLMSTDTKSSRRIIQLLRIPFCSSEFETKAFAVDKGHRLSNYDVATNSVRYLRFSYFHLSRCYRLQ